MFLFKNTANEPIFHASREEQVVAIDKLIAQGSFHSGYYLLLILAAGIVTPGLFVDNVSIVIGGMILAPLLVPLLSLSLSLVTGNLRGVFRSLRILLLSVIIVVAVSAAISFALKEAYDSFSWYPQGINPAVYIFIAFCAGVAGAFAWVKEDLAPAIAGVATAVALLPPLCATGIALVELDYQLIETSLVIFAANLVGIIVAAFLVFWIMGFLRARKLEDKAIKQTDGKK